MTVGTLRESSLHAALKAHYAQPGDLLEEPADGYWIDIVRGAELIEIQTGSFTALRPKLAHFLPDRPVRVVLPLLVDKLLVRFDREGQEVSRRRSPKRQRDVDLFAQLVHLAQHAADPGFSLELARVRVEELRLADGKGSWRRGGLSIVDRRLLEVVGRRRFEQPTDYLALLPDDLPQPFTVAELSLGIGGPRRLAGQMAYTLRHMGALRVEGKRGNALLYSTHHTESCGPGAS
jgi:hypothetical protein